MIKLAKCLIVVLCVISVNTWGISDAEILKSLETLGDWKAAHPLAQKLAQQQNTYPAWRNLAVKYAQFDTNKVAYLQTWQQACQLNQVNIYKDFVTLSPDSPLNLLAIQAIFKLTQSVDDIQAYLNFMETFPTSIEALQALLRVHELAFTRTQQLNLPEVYDAFIAAFPGAKQVVQAVERAYQTEKQTVMDALSGKSPEEIALLARRLFNEARIAEKEKADNPVAARKYRLLLEIDAFKETSVVTDLLDREERLAFQKLVLDQQTQVNQNVQRMQEAIVQAIQAQTKDLGDVITKQSAVQQQKFDELIVSHQQMLAGINKFARIETVHSTLDAAEKMTTIIPWLKAVKVTDNDEFKFNWCGTVATTTGIAVSMVPIASTASLPASLGAKMACEAIPSIVKFFKDFF